MNSPTVCAIVLDYYGAEKTKKCLVSLMGQGLKTVYVLDNSQKSEAGEILRQAVNAVLIQGPDFEIEVISAGLNLGFGKGVNYVIAHDKQTPSPHDFYLLLNNDAVAGPGLVTNMLPEFKRDISVALVSPRVVCNGSGPEFGIWYHRYFGLLLSRPGLGRFHYFTGCCLFFPRNLATASGIFDESFFMYGEDAELGWRLIRLGKKMVCAQNAFVQHEYGPSVDRSSFFYEYHMARSHFLLSRKTWMHPVEVPLLVLIKLIGLGARATLRCWRYKTFTPIFSLLIAWLPLRVDKT
jgi:N-acetylglucosaminyl-diphospho-decaprenol L-rhamnosyltransferase